MHFTWRTYPHAKPFTSTDGVQILLNVRSPPLQRLICSTVPNKSLIMEFANDPVQPRPFTTTTTTTTPLTEAKRLKVLVAIDDSEQSTYALQWALDNILACPAGAATAVGTEADNTIVLLHVHPPFHHYVYPAGPAISSSIDISDSVRKLQKQQSANIVAKAADACKDRKVRVESMVLEGDAKEMICEAVEKLQADFLVIGSRGLGKIKRAFLGSVSDYCAHHANCPVLIVKYK